MFSLVGLLELKSTPPERVWPARSQFGAPFEGRGTVYPGPAPGSAAQLQSPQMDLWPPTGGRPHWVWRPSLGGPTVGAPVLG